MGDRKFYLYKRKNGYYYAEILNPEGTRVLYRSTRSRNQVEAAAIVGRWLAEGVPVTKGRSKKPFKEAVNYKQVMQYLQNGDIDETQALELAGILKKRGLLAKPVVKAGRGSESFVQFLENFWDYDSSLYVKELKAAGQSIHRSHCYQRYLTIKSFYADYFKDKLLCEINRVDWESFFLYLAEPRKKPIGYKGPFTEKLSAAYRNNILIAGKTALRWAYNKEIIDRNPTASTKKISGISKKRGILTQAEAERIFHDVEWKDQRAFVASLIACTTGLRSGEVLGLRKSDLQEKFLLIRHSWSTIDKLKTTKTNAERKVNLYPEVKEKILDLLNDNPFKDTANPFIFYSLYENQPVDGKVLLNGFKDACDAAGIAHKERNIGFHSWRHYWAAYMAPRMEKDKLMLSTGHRTAAVFDVYANHEIAENLDEVGKVGAEAFANILKFRKAG